MSAIRRSLWIVALLALVPALPAAAEVYEVTLKNGTQFETRYQPRVAEWDESKVLLVSSQGNSISFYKDDIESISVDTEVQGFGTVIKAGTIALGWAPNDAEVPGEGPGGADGSPAEQVLNFLREQQRPAPPPFNVQQFAEPTVAGEATTGGIPLGLINTNTPPLGVVVPDGEQ